MKKIVSVSVVVLLCLILAGCGLIPKKVELFQDKVHVFPEPTAYQKELERKVAERLKETTAEVARRAAEERVSNLVQKPANDAAVLADSLSITLGPPKEPAPIDYEARQLARELLTAVAKLNLKVDDFKKDNNENAGKKIEGTGLFQIPYIVWAGGACVIFFIGFIILGIAWTALKAYAISNPPVQLGVHAVQMGSAVIQRGLKEIVHGGELFKDKVKGIVTDPELQKKIIDTFQTEHQRAQSSDIQALVQAMTVKPS